MRIELLTPFWYWIILAIVFAVGEVFTAGFFLLWFGVGAAIAAVVSLTFPQLWLQIVAFLSTSFILVIFSRQIVSKTYRKPPKQISVDSVIGKEGVVTKDIGTGEEAGKIKVESWTWRATSKNGEPIKRGEIAKVLKVEGTKVIVEKVKEKEGKEMSEE